VTSGIPLTRTVDSKIRDANRRTPGVLSLRSLREGELDELLTRLRLHTSTSASSRP
jgi:hypothetical protein